MSSNIDFSRLKTFPSLQGNTISTNDFLQASEDIVSAMENFSSFLNLITSDMRKNIQTLRQRFRSNQGEYRYLHSLMSTDGVALCWLKRALECLYKFFEKIVNDRSRSEALKSHLQAAYDETLRQHHGNIGAIGSFSMMLFGFIVPYRSQLLGTGSTEEGNLVDLRRYLSYMESNLQCLNDLGI